MKSELVELQVKLDVEFELKLNSYSTSGYVWEVVFDPIYLTKCGSNEIIQSENFGSENIEKVIFKPIRKGETKIILKNKRPWEAESYEEIIYVIHVVD